MGRREALKLLINGQPLRPGFSSGGPGCDARRLLRLGLADAVVDQVGRARWQGCSKYSGHSTKVASKGFIFH